MKKNRDLAKRWTVNEMERKKKIQWGNKALIAGKIAAGSCISLYIAGRLNLQFAASAAIITHLTIVTTKWETLKLSFYRLVSFCVTVFLSWIIFENIQTDWAAYGIFVLLLILLCEWAGWRAAISANAVIGTHFLQTHDFGISFLVNEVLLVLIGILMAILINLFQNIEGQKKKLEKRVQCVEERMQMILEDLAKYLFGESISEQVWEEIRGLESQLELDARQADRYQNNTFQTYADYYTHYFEMRAKQCSILYSLHHEIRRVRKLPMQAKMVGEYMAYLRQHVSEMNDPSQQQRRLRQLLEELREEALPKTREEFENRAKLYHILMDLEEFLICKKRFTDTLNEKQKQLYWGTPDRQQR